MLNIRSALLYAGLDKRELESLLSEAIGENSRYVGIYAAASAPVFALCFLAGTAAGGMLGENRPVYFAMACFCLLLYAYSRLVLPKRPAMSTLLAVGYLIALYAFSFSVSMLHPDMPGVAPIAVLLVAPLLFNYRPIYMTALTIVAGAAYCALSFGLKERSLAFSDFWNTLFFGGAAVLLSVFQMRVKFRLLRQKQKIRRMSETDLLTGAKNRNCFENSRDRYAERCRENMTCVFVDANGLHEMNDTRGHEAGDIMLQTVAAAMIDRFGAENTYRIGGDEFVALLTDTAVKDAREKIRGMIGVVNEKGFSVSVGASFQEKAELDTKELVKQAERYMYKEKKEYYEGCGHDRRRRVMGQ